MRTGDGRLIFVEVALLALVLALAIAVKAQPGPLPGDVGVAVAWQHAVLPHHTLTAAVEEVSTVAWPVPQAATLAVVALALLLLRRVAAAALSLLTVGLADGSSYLVAELVRRPRPGDHGLQVLSHIARYYSFPSGHVVHAFAYAGFLLFLTTTVRRPTAAAWRPVLVPVRAVLLAVIVLMGPSRVLEGEHWPSDALGGALCGLFWLVLAVHAYRWIEARRGRHSGVASRA